MPLTLEMQSCLADFFFAQREARQRLEHAFDAVLTAAKAVTFADQALIRLAEQAQAEIEGLPSPTEVRH